MRVIVQRYIFYVIAVISMEKIGDTIDGTLLSCVGVVDTRQWKQHWETNR